MKRHLVLITVFALLCQSFAVLAEEIPIAGPDLRLYLKDGTLIEGQLIEKSDDLIIVRVRGEIFTFDRNEVDKIVTLDSLGGGARTITVTEFPYISFLGGTVAFGLLAWLQFDRADEKQREADLNREYGQLKPAAKLEDKADRARLLGWSSAILAAGSLGVALIPRKSTRRVFPELTLENGASTLRIACHF